MQKESGKWYFHKQGGTYKSGTYMGLDLAFGKGNQAAGGISLRSLIPADVINCKVFEKPAHYNDLKKDFIEGPCNCVRKILETTKPEGLSKFGIPDLVGHADFNLDAFDKKSCMYLQ